MWLSVSASPEAVLDGAEARQRVVRARRGRARRRRRARGPRHVVERVADGLGAPEAMEQEDRLLEVQRGRALGPSCSGHSPKVTWSKKGVSSSGTTPGAPSASSRTTRGLLACRSGTRGHGRGAASRRRQARVAEPAARGDRVGEELGGTRGAADRLLVHGVLVERRGGGVLVAQLAVVAHGGLRATQVLLGVAAAQREPGAGQQRLDAQRGRLGRGEQRRVEPAVALGEVAAVQPEAPQRGRQRRAACGSRRRAKARRRAQVVVLGLQRAQRAALAGRERVVLARPAPGTSRGGARRRLAARPTRRAARRRTGGWSPAGGSARPVRLTTSDLSTSRASRSTTSARVDRRRRRRRLGRLQRRSRRRRPTAGGRARARRR